jgi:hypothetical protein
MASGGAAASPAASPSSAGRAAEPAAARVLTRLGLTSARGGTGLPFTVGQPLARGQVPAGAVLRSAEVPGLQFAVRNRWPDGSAKFALLSGSVNLQAGVTRHIDLRVAPAAGNAEAAVSSAALRRTGVEARIDFGEFGAVSWSGADWERPERQLIAGPQMSAWTYRKPLGNDAHLVAWLEVRAYKGGQVEVLPWIENGHLNVPGGTEKSATATFSLGGQPRFSQPLTLLNHQRAVLAGPDTLTHWLNADPQLTPAHDTAYFMSTRLVPHYRAVTVLGSPLFKRLATHYEPLGQANYPNGMGSSGYHPSIGLLPEWDVAYLTTGAEAHAWRAVLINALSAGRYGLHYRDEKTHRPLAFASYPDLLMFRGSNVSDLGGSSAQQFTPAVGGGLPPLYKMSHHPSMGYMAYLLSGWSYFLEELQFVATANCITQPNLARQRSRCVFMTGQDHGSQVRAVAWALRTMSQAAAATPDDDPLRAQFVQSVEANVDFFHGRYVAQPSNPLGVVEPYGHYPAKADQWRPDPASPDAWFFGIWQDDFLTGSFGFMKELALLSPALQSRLDAFLAWKYRAVVGRLGAGEGEFPYPLGAQYTVAVAPGNDADYKTGKGPWYRHWGDVARAMNLPAGAKLGDPLVVGWPTIPTGYWGDLLPALSYAVEHKAAGADAAWQRFSTAPNLQTFLERLNDEPVWSVWPR